MIAALATTDSEFPLHLWDRLTPQVRGTLNLMRASHINPAISAYEALNGPYDWNRYPLAPLGCKAIVNKDGDTRGSWASRGIDGWYLGPSKDHYRCALYYIPETRAYRISGSTELFLQHCQLPNLSADQHFRALTDKLAHEMATANKTPMGRCLIKLLQSKIMEILDVRSCFMPHIVLYRCFFNLSRRNIGLRCCSLVIYFRFSCFSADC